MLKMLIAVDGSEYSQRAIATVARLATQTQGIEVVLLDAALTEARRLGLTQVSTQGEQGAAAGAIVRAAEALGVDQIVIGTHGRSPLGGLFMGSVAQRVAHLAKVPVLLVK